MPDMVKVIKGLEACIANNCRDCPYPCFCDYADDWPHELHKDALKLLKKQETVEHALDVLRKNGWKEEETCEKCTLLTAVSDGVHDMAKQFRRKVGEVK